MFIYLDIYLYIFIWFIFYYIRIIVFYMSYIYLHSNTFIFSVIYLVTLCITSVFTYSYLASSLTLLYYFFSLVRLSVFVFLDMVIGYYYPRCLLVLSLRDGVIVGCLAYFIMSLLVRCPQVYILSRNVGFGWINWVWIDINSNIWCCYVWFCWIRCLISKKRYWSVLLLYSYFELEDMYWY